MPHCQTFKQKIKELKGKAQNIEALLSEYVKTVDKKTEKEIEGILKEIEEFKQEFKTKATQLIEEFIQRRENKNEKVEIIFDERDGRFIIEGTLHFFHRTHFNDFPSLIKKITEDFFAIKAQTIDLPNLEEIGRDFWAENAQTINLPNLERIGGFFGANNAQTINLPNLKEVGEDFWALNAQTINLPNIKEIGGDIHFQEGTSNFASLVEKAKKWREKGILKGRIFIITTKNEITEIP
jgi:hypothetical protein